MAVDPGCRRVAITALLGLALAGCGGTSRPRSSTSATTSSEAAVNTTSLTTTTSTTRAHTTTRPRRAHTHRTTSTATSSTTATSTAPPPIPSGTPAAPDGLRQVTGYGSYELCAGTCTGGVPAALRRPLHLPHGCPASGGGGPVAPAGGTADIHISDFIGSAWRAARVQWAASGSYGGPVLIRGRRLDGPGAVGFGEGRVPDDELQLLHSGQQAPPAPGGGRSWLSFTRVRSPGCYAYQVDGTSFSRVIVFRAR